MIKLMEIGEEQEVIYPDRERQEEPIPVILPGQVPVEEPAPAPLPESIPSGRLAGEG
ncbi:MAG: hypothetical protein R3335_08575 [Anaerolineales bacterium]|nr:hypothetical protein [Anaerolineales bacterium]